MKSRMKPELRVVPAAQVQSLSVEGVLPDVRCAFYGLCVNAGKLVLAAIMEAGRVVLRAAGGEASSAHSGDAAVHRGRCRVLILRHAE